MIRIRPLRAASLVASAGILSMTTASLAGEARTHDGFLLRLSGGGGYAETAIDLPPGSLDPAQTQTANLKLSGASGDINFAIGGMVAPNLAVHATLWGWLVSSPDVKIDDVDVGALTDWNVSINAYGAGVTYYFVPINVYVSPSVGIAIGSLEEGGTTVNTDTGFAFDATVGKEWWVGDGWGIGLAGGFGWYSVPDGDVDARWTGPSFGARFSATMN